MKSLIKILAIFLLLAGAPLAPAADPSEAILGDALLNEEAYSFLAAMVTRYGHRMPGTPGNARSLDYLQKELENP